jgi:hypothetical protein
MASTVDRKLRLRWRRAQKAARMIARLPFVRYVGVNGSLARGASHANSDIDLFIVIEEGHLWKTRLAITLLIHTHGLRRTNIKIAGRICLNRFFTTEHLEITPHTLGNAREFCAQVPLYDAGDYHARFAESNSWVWEFGYRFSRITSDGLRVMNAGQLVKESIEKALSFRFGQWLEQLVKRPQYRRIARDPRTYDPKGLVVFTDRELTFNPPRRNGSF